MERLGRVALLHRHPDLLDDGAVIDFLVDEVDGDTRRLNTLVESVLDGEGAGERGQQRGVDVEHPPGETVEEHRSQDSHEPGEDDPFGPTLLHFVGQRR